jgi:cytidyltransferase-like protein
MNSNISKLVIVSGYFDPIHVGHLELFKTAKEFAGDMGIVIAIVNTDHQARLKKDKAFMQDIERVQICKAIRYIDDAMLALDTDRTVCKSLEYIATRYTTYDIYFANGGDQNNKTIKEAKICLDNKIKLIDGFGKKIQSSSWLLNSITAV